MPNITIVVRNREKVLAALQGVSNRMPRILLDSIKKGADRAVTEAKIYPPPPANSRYTRTFTFQNAWRIQSIGQSALKIMNAANQKGRMYPVYVMGDKDGGGQAGVHMGRWKLIIDVVNKNFENIDDVISEEILSYAKSKGL